MNRQAKIEFIQDELLKWYAHNKRKFPWRKSSMSNYQYIIAETLLQRTKAETISKFYPVFIKRFPNWKSLNNASEKSIADFLKPIGLYNQRAARLKQLASEMVTLNGRLPRTRHELENIPFLGQYIVNAVFLFIHKKPAPLLDVNMARVLERMFGNRLLADLRHDHNLQKLAQAYISHTESKKLNWAILDFAALICKPKPKCSDCPLKSKCLNYRITHNKKQ